MVACMLIYSHVTNRRRRIGHKYLFNSPLLRRVAKVHTLFVAKNVGVASTLDNHQSWAILI